jgi:N-formylglutamate amidohydrolase
LQIEVNRSLYLNESTLTRSRNFVRVKQDLTNTIAQLLRELPNIMAWQTAAE